MIDIIRTTITLTCFNTNWKETGSTPLTLITCGLVLHSLLFIEMQLNKFTLAKIVNPTKNTFLTNPSILLHYVIIFFSLNIYEYQQYHQHQ